MGNKRDSGCNEGRISSLNDSNRGMACRAADSRWDRIMTKGRQRERKVGRFGASGMEPKWEPAGNLKGKFAG